MTCKMCGSKEIVKIKRKADTYICVECGAKIYAIDKRG